MSKASGNLSTLSLSTIAVYFFPFPSIVMVSRRYLPPNFVENAPISLKVTVLPDILTNASRPLTIPIPFAFKLSGLISTLTRTKATSVSLPDA